jgi:hypothetical protein
MEPSDEIGGYFGLELPDHGDAFPTAIGFQSARAALRAVLESANTARVLLPAYICDPVIRAVVDAGAMVETYGLDDSLYPRDLPHRLSKNTVVLYVNYFGLCGTNVRRLLEVVPRCQLIVDNSQALLTPPTMGFATLYSPRKFVGVPDGGLLVTALTIGAPKREDTGSLGRMTHLLQRMAHTAQDGYVDFLASEDSLSDTTPLRMSRLTRHVLSSIDMTAVKRKRRDNFATLAIRLDEYNVHGRQLDAESAPLCYPLVLPRNVERLKSALLAKRVYVPTYWPEVRSRAYGGIENELTNCCLMLPCDQRCSPDQMSSLADTIVSCLDR